MQSRPTEPTSALAALIAGNHRHVERRGAGLNLGAATSGTHAFPQRPFALAVAAPGPVAVTPHIFALGHHEVLVVDALHEVGDHVLAHDVKLIVVIETIASQFVSRHSTWMHAELRAFSRVETILRGGPEVRDGVARGDIRVVAAILEHPSERIHWIGEHPEAEFLVRDG